MLFAKSTLVQAKQRAGRNIGYPGTVRTRMIGLCRPRLSNRIQALVKRSAILKVSSVDTTESLKYPLYSQAIAVPLYTSAKRLRYHPRSASDSLFPVKILDTALDNESKLQITYRGSTKSDTLHLRCRIASKALSTCRRPDLRMVLTRFLSHLLCTNLPDKNTTWVEQRYSHRDKSFGFD